jgi:putative transposase
MSFRKANFVQGEYYHLYNRGVEKRSIFEDEEDSERFLKSMIMFNTVEPIGSIYQQSFHKGVEKKREPLVNFISYCLNPNHFHVIAVPLVEKGIQMFMHRLGTGYTMYFNEKYKRCGALFQGVFKSTHIDSDKYLLHLSVYVNLNYLVHQLGGEASKLVRTSWNEFIEPTGTTNNSNVCNKDIVLGQFKSTDSYKQYALSTLPNIISRKQNEKEIGKLLID